jgi:hypothetical protein
MAGRTASGRPYLALLLVVGQVPPVRGPPQGQACLDLSRARGSPGRWRGGVVAFMVSTPPLPLTKRIPTDRPLVVHHNVGKRLLAYGLAYFAWCLVLLGHQAARASAVDRACAKLVSGIGSGTPPPRPGRLDRGKP